MADEYEYRRTRGTTRGGDAETEQDTTRKTRVVIEEELPSDLAGRTYTSETANLDELSEVAKQRLERRLKEKATIPTRDSQPLRIKAIEVAKLKKFLNARGESRKISVVGTKGAGFSLIIKDSNDKNILELSNVEIPESGAYTINQKFPSIVTSSRDTEVRETYDIIITPSAGVESNSIEVGIPTHTLKQYADTTISVSPVTTQTGPAISITTGSSGISRKHQAGTRGLNIANHNAKAYTITCEEDSVTSGLFYIKDGNFNKHLTTDSVIKKVVDRCGEEGHTNQLVLDPKTTRTKVVDGKTVILSDLEAGMRVSCKIEKDKIVTSSLGVDDDEQETNRFDLNNTTDLFPDMQLSVRGFRKVHIVSIDCNKSITVSDKVRIKKNTNVTFKYRTRSTVLRVVHQSNSKGQAVVDLIGAMKVPDKAELEFDINNSNVIGTMGFSNSGSKSVSINSSVIFSKYGTSNVTYSLDIDKMITRIPNAHNQDVEFDRHDSTKTINVIKQDYDKNASSKVVTITSGTSHGSTTISGTSITYVPVTDFTGVDQLKFTVSDGTNSSLEKTIRIIVK